MPVFKVWNCDRSVKKACVASSLKELKSKGRDKNALTFVTLNIRLRILYAYTYGPMAYNNLTDAKCNCQRAPVVILGI